MYKLGWRQKTSVHSSLGTVEPCSSALAQILRNHAILLDLLNSARARAMGIAAPTRPITPFR